MFYTADKISKRFVIKLTCKTFGTVKYFHTHVPKHPSKSYHGNAFFMGNLFTHLESFNEIKTYATQKNALKAIEKYGLTYDNWITEVIQLSDTGCQPYEAA